ncbi:MAG: hypothetical protein DRO11_01460 [Methanobacteriota archaeon]|nr:MAG: hypothetical protein DRO11_01460 [Euryarchaeota archaeon]
MPDKPGEKHGDHARVFTLLGVALLATPLLYGLTRTNPSMFTATMGFGLLVLCALLFVLGKKEFLPFSILLLLLYLHHLLFGDVLYHEIQQGFTFKTIIFITLPLLLTIRLSTLTPGARKMGGDLAEQHLGGEPREQHVHPQNLLWDAFGVGVAMFVTYLCLNPHHVTLALGIPQYVVRYYYLETATILLVTLLLLALGANTLYHTTRRTKEKILRWEKTGWKRG